MGQCALCGETNSRIADLHDYIEGMDSVKERNIIDFNKNVWRLFD